MSLKNSLKGIDISHHNKYQFMQKQIDFSKYDFIMMKVTEGRTFVDPMCKTYMDEIIRLEKRYGFYHFARPTRNSAIDEAKHFCDTIGVDGIGAMLALDWEAEAVNCDLQWALDWLNYVEKRYHKKPLFYCSSFYTKKLKPILDNNNGLWVAHYTKADKPKVYTYPFYTMWQYTSTPYDKDVFNGSKEAWDKYVYN